MKNGGPAGRPLLPVMCLILVWSSLLFIAVGALHSAPVAPGQIEGTWTTYANGDDVRALAIQGDTLWAGTKGGGVVQWNTSAGTYVQYLHPQTGLAGNDVRAVAIDGLGRKWFGTSRGVSMLSADGRTWTTYTSANTNNGLGSDDVTTVAVDCEGNLWFGTKGGGVSRYDGGLWQRYTTTNGLASNDVVAIAVDSACRVWVGFGKAGGGVSRYDGGWTTYTRQSAGLGSDRVLSIAADQTGSVWFGTFGGGASVFDGRTWRIYTSYDGLASNYVWAIDVDEAGRVWLAAGTSGGTGRGVSAFDGSAWMTYTTAHGLTSDTVWAIAHGAGKVWFGTDQGLSLFHEATWQTYTTASTGLVSNRVTAIAFDSHGRAWFGTDGGGVSVFDPLSDAWTAYTKESTDSDGTYPWDGLASNRISAIAFDGQGRAWIGTREDTWDAEKRTFLDGGVSVFDGHNWQVYTQKNTDDDGRAPWRGLASNDVSALAIDDGGNVWIGTGDLYDFTGSGLNVFDGHTWTTYHHPTVASDNITAIALDRARDRVWIAGAPYLISGWRAGGGVSIWDGSTWQIYEPSSTDLIAYDNDVRAVAVDHAGVGWIGAWNYEGNTLPYDWPYVDAVVNRFDGAIWTATAFPGEGYISAIAVDHSGRVWAGTSLSGMKIFDGSQWLAFTVANSGLASNDIRTIAVDANGDVWIGTWNRGVSRFHEAEPVPTETATPTPTSTPVPKHIFLPLTLKDR